MKIYFEMMSAVCRQCGLRREDIREKSIEVQDDHICICFLTDWQRYEVYLDSYSLELAGINTEPRILGDYTGKTERKLYQGSCA